MELSSEQIRWKRTNFWLSKKHQEAIPVSLVAPNEDKTVIFNVAGMQPLVPYLSGKPHPKGKRLYNIQKCIRTNDIDEVGDERHLTMFEMMWNRSLGDYYKKESLLRSIEFITKQVGLDINKLGCSIFWWYYDENNQELIPYDHEAEEVLLKAGIEKNRIKAIAMEKGKKCDNFRWPPGKIWPCWPCAEFHYDRWEERGPNDRNIGENDRFIEIRNNVFMEYYKDEAEEYSKLSQQNVDTGMWLERLMMIIQKKETIFETDLFQNTMTSIEKLSQKDYPPYQTIQSQQTKSQKEQTQSFRIIADHIRASVFLIADWVVPSNELRGYVLRRLIRRAFFHYSKLTSKVDIKKFATDLTQSVIDKYKAFFTELENATNIEHVLIEECNQFQKTLDRGEKKLYDILGQKNSAEISGEEAFLLYDTFGFPLDLTKELAQKSGYSVDEAWYEEAMKHAKVKAKKSSSNKFVKEVDRAKYLQWIQPTKFIGYDTTHLENPQIIKQFSINDQHIIIFDKTPFYAEWGWQTGDSGIIILNDGTHWSISTVMKYEGVFLHFIDKV